jgi:membrane-associated phospholipid phosphatase
VDSSDGDARARRAQIAGASAALVAFAVVVQQVMTDGRLVALDRRLADHYSRNRLGQIRSVVRLVGNGPSQRVGRILSLFGDAPLLIGAAIILGFLLYQWGRRRDAVFLATALVGGILLDLVVRVAVGHLRPDLPFPYFLISRFGLPSGHALDAIAFYGALLVISWPRFSRGQRLVATVATTVFVAGIAYSRVVVLAHYLTDVLAGVTLGIAWLLLLSVAFNLPRHDDRLPSTA